MASSVRKGHGAHVLIGTTETVGPYGKKQVHDRAGLPCIFRNVIADQYSRPDSAGHHQQSFSGILSTALVGGAIIPVIIGRIGDYAGLRIGMAFLYVTFGFVFSIGFWAKPLITNATISIKKAPAEVAV